MTRLQRFEGGVVDGHRLCALGLPNNDRHDEVILVDYCPRLATGLVSSVGDSMGDVPWGCLNQGEAEFVKQVAQLVYPSAIIRQGYVARRR